MTTSMGPPPPRDGDTTSTSSEPPAVSADISTTMDAAGPWDETLDSTSTSAPEPMQGAMGPPPPRDLKSSIPAHEQPELKTPELESSGATETPGSLDDSTSINVVKQEKQQSSHNVVVPYTIPEWSGAPCYEFSLEVLKDGCIIGQFDVNKKGAYMFGRVDLCDFVLEHPTISRFHAVIQFRHNGAAYLYDLGSTHGTFINKKQVKQKAYVDLHVGDVIRFGQSSRLYIFQGPADLMPPEADAKSIRKAKIQQEMQDMEASLLRARVEASLADGVSWGMREDAIEETEDEVDEITWQTYKGQLTEKQEKTREKVIKRLEKIAHMKKEIDAIRAKDIAQGGLTQGQQTQIARNEQRISQIMEELENLEETLNESIQESVGARAGGISCHKKKGAAVDDEEEYLSEEDEFYDRTQKPSKHKGGDNQSVETADSLLDKRDTIVKEMEDKRKLLLIDDEKAPETDAAEAGDALDAYMSEVSSQLVIDKKEKFHKELSALQSELDRVLYLLKIADPTGEAARKRELRAQGPKADVSNSPDLASKHSLSVKSGSAGTDSVSDASAQSLPQQNQNSGAEGLLDMSTPGTSHVKAMESGKKPDDSDSVIDKTENEPTIYTVAKPRWLGAVEAKAPQENAQMPIDTEDGEFVDYKDRKRILSKSDSDHVNKDSGLENAAPGLIIRKRKEVQKSDSNDIKSSEEHSTGTDIKAEDAVALLLKHSRGYQASDEDGVHTNEDVTHGSEEKGQKRPRRVLGPERPSFLKKEPDYESWVPPEGQSGDGRTALNDRFGY